MIFTHKINKIDKILFCFIRYSFHLQKTTKLLNVTLKTYMEKEFEILFI